MKPTSRAPPDRSPSWLPPSSRGLPGPIESGSPGSNRRRPRQPTGRSLAEAPPAVAIEIPRRRRDRPTARRRRPTYAPDPRPEGASPPRTRDRDQRERRGSARASRPPSVTTTGGPRTATSGSLGTTAQIGASRPTERVVHAADGFVVAARAQIRRAFEPGTELVIVRRFETGNGDPRRSHTNLIPRRRARLAGGRLFWTGMTPESQRLPDAKVRSMEASGVLDLTSGAFRSPSSSPAGSLEGRAYGRQDPLPAQPLRARPSPRSHERPRRSGLDGRHRCRNAHPASTDPRTSGHGRPDSDDTFLTVGRAALRLHGTRAAA